jgi:glycosyltransferase involved in cell wall biosynthesis
VIPTFNRADSLKRLLGSLARAAGELDELEVVVVDDGSTDRTAEVARDAPLPVRHLPQPNAGPAAARNRGWRAAAHEMVLFVDDDCEIEPGTLEATVRELEQLDAVGGTIVPRSRERLLEVFTDLEGLVGHKVVDGHVKYLVTACMATKRSVLSAVGGFDTGFPFAAGEDADLSMTLIEEGYTLGVSSGLRVIHDHRTALRAMIRTYYRHGTGQTLLLAKHPARKASLGSSARERLSPAAWRAVYRRYRLATSVPMSAASLVLRAAMMVPWLIGARRGARSALPPELKSGAVVAMVNDVASIGGGQQVMLDVADGLAAGGFEPVILSPPGWLADQARARGIRWQRVEFANRKMLTERLRLPRPSAVLTRRADAVRLDAVLTDLGAGIVHTGALVPHLVSMFLPRRARHVVWHVNQVSPAALFAGRLPDRVIGVSEAVLAPGRWRRGLASRATVVGNAVDLDRFVPLDADARVAMRRAFELPTDAPLLITVGRLEPAKGIHTLVDIASRCTTKPTLVVVGGPPAEPDPSYIDGLHRAAVAAGCDLRLLGEQADVAGLIAAADLFVFASVWEAFGLVLAEAAACGVPAVSGPAGGCREVVEDGVSGVLVDPLQPDEFARVIDELLGDNARRHSMGARARSIAEQRFDKSHYQEVVAGHFAHLLSPR